MPTYLQYHQRRAAGLCPVCGRERDQRPYVQCSSCLSPKPRRSIVPDIAYTDPAYGPAYRWHHRQQREPAVAVGCCGVFHAVTQVPFRTPCCGRVFGDTSPAEGTS